MKRTVALALLGVVAATTAYGQGGVQIGSYRGAYNPVVFDGTSDGVPSAAGVNLTIWFAEGAGLSSGQLTENVPMPWNTSAEGNGYLGYYGNIVVTLPDWVSNDIYSFQVRADGTAFGESAIWEEQANIGFIGGTPPGLPGISGQSQGFSVIVPEPTTFALAGLGAAALLIFRRRD